MDSYEIIKDEESPTKTWNTEPFECSPDIYWILHILPKDGHNKLSLGLELDSLPQDIDYVRCGIHLVWKDINASRYVTAEFKVIGERVSQPIAPYIYFKHFAKKNEQVHFKIFLTVLDIGSHGKNLWHYTPSINLIQHKQCSWQWKLDDNTLQHCKQCEPGIIFSDNYMRYGIFGVAIAPNGWDEESSWEITYIVYCSILPDKILAVSCDVQIKIREDPRMDINANNVLFDHRRQCKAIGIEEENEINHHDFCELKSCTMDITVTVKQIKMESSGEWVDIDDDTQIPPEILDEFIDIEMTAETIPDETDTNHILNIIKNDNTKWSAGGLANINGEPIEYCYSMNVDHQYISTMKNATLSRIGQRSVGNGNRQRVDCYLTPGTSNNQNRKLTIRMIYDRNGKLTSDCFPHVDDEYGILALKQGFINKTRRSHHNAIGNAQRGWGQLRPKPNQGNPQKSNYEKSIQDIENSESWEWKNNKNTPKVKLLHGRGRDNDSWNMSKTDRARNKKAMMDINERKGVRRSTRARKQTKHQTQQEIDEQLKQAGIDFTSSDNDPTPPPKPPRNKRGRNRITTKKNKKNNTSRRKSKRKKSNTEASILSGQISNRKRKRSPTNMDKQRKRIRFAPTDSSSTNATKKDEETDEETESEA